MLVNDSTSTLGKESVMFCSNDCNFSINWTKVSSGNSGEINPLDLYSLYTSTIFWYPLSVTNSVTTASLLFGLLAPIAAWVLDCDSLALLDCCGVTGVGPKLNLWEYMWGAAVKCPIAISFNILNLYPWNFKLTW